MNIRKFEFVAKTIPLYIVYSVHIFLYLVLYVQCNVYT